MGQIRINSCYVISSACLALLFAGCLSIPISPTPRFYKLQAIHEDQAIKKMNTASQVLIGVGPVKIPEYLDRPQIVTRGKEMTLKFAQFDRWVEPLDLGVARLLREDLTVVLPKARLIAYPWNQLMPVKYQVVVEIIQLDSELDKELFLVAQWQVIDVESRMTLIINRSVIRQSIIPQDYPGLAMALSAACASFSREIAAALAMLEDH